MGKKETTISKESFNYIGKNPNFRIFRNNVGMAYQGTKAKGSNRETLILMNPRPIKFGLQKGSSDYILLKRRVITQDDVGKTFAQFGALEFKQASGKAEEEQKAFIQTVLKMGGFAGISKSLEDSIAICEIDE